MSDAARPDPASAPHKRWRLRYGDQVFGPFDRTELEDLLADRRLDRDSLLAEEGSGEDWRRAGEIPELDGLFPAPAAPSKAKPPRLRAEPGQPDPMMLHLIYALYAAFFVVGFTPIIGVILAYVKKPDAEGSWQASHYEWLIRTFWIGLAFMVIGGITTIVLIGSVIMFLGGIWFLYRIIKGWIRLGQLRAVEDPTGFF
jgi:uncharacterized membrane protein